MNEHKCGENKMRFLSFELTCTETIMQER